MWLRHRALVPAWGAVLRRPLHSGHVGDVRDRAALERAVVRRLLS